jgi:hypothetical protein
MSSNYFLPEFGSAMNPVSVQEVPSLSTCRRTSPHSVSSGRAETGVQAWTRNKTDVIHKGEERHYNVIVLPPPPNPAHFPSLATGPNGAMHPYFYKLPAGLQCEIFESSIDGSPGKLLHQHTVINKE